MKAVRLHAYGKPPVVDEVAEPEITGPNDVIVRVGGAGLCRTDLHVRDGWFADAVPVDLPLTLGHETAGWVHAVGSAVEHIAVGDTVICHPNMSCGTCPACWAGQEMRCVKGLNFPGVTRDGGFAELVKTSARAVLPLDPRVEPAEVAALADGGLSAYHAVRKQLPALEPGSRVVVIGAGGLGHIGIQCLVALTSAEIIVLDRNPEALKLAEQCGAHHRVEADGRQVERVRELTGGTGAEAVLDFVGEDDTVPAALGMLAPGGRYDVVGYGGSLTIPTVQLVLGEVQVAGSLVGTLDDLAALVRLTAAGQVSVRTALYPLDAVNDAIADLEQERVRGRAILTPSTAA
ncbi:MAG TPA: NAD(P)-dependent alcohol dehydrogenase [Actinomycetes bacterium]|jgi:NAD+-dependent secondary alcohol dehydrogenase Adh1